MNKLRDVRRPFRLLGFLVILALLFPLARQTAAGAPDPQSRGVRGIEYAKSKLAPDLAFGAWKKANAEQLALSAPLQSPLSNFSTSVTQYVIEPEGSDYDDNSPRVWYVDGNYWNFCTAGAVAASMWYWRSTNVTAWPAGSFIEPTGAATRVSTYWNSSDYDGNSPNYFTQGRNYIMYIAEQVNPPSYTSPGEIDFSSVTGNLVDMRDAINWEASGHGGNWATYFYYVVTAGSLTSSSLHTDIVSDVNSYLAPVIVITKTSALPNWANGNVIHAISIIGYDDTAGTYTYLDTCGKRCGSNSDGGVYTVNQTALYNGIQAAGSTIGGIVY